MRLVERSYGGKAFRPRPEVHCDESNGIALIVFPWGSRAAARKAIQTIADHVLASHSDQEATTPFEQNPSMTPLANSLKSAFLLANEQIHREDNRDEYLVGLEVTAIAVQGEEVCVAQVGGASVYLDLPEYDLSALGPIRDHSLFRSTPNETMAPLPAELMGVTPMLPVHIISFAKPTKASLLLIARTFIPARTLVGREENHTLEVLTQQLSRQSMDLPFWIGQLELS